jgi:hypothetical protein
MVKRMKAKTVRDVHKLMVIQLIEKFPTFEELDSSVPCTQKLGTLYLF